MSDEPKVDNDTPSPLKNIDPHSSEADKISDADIEAAIHGKTEEEFEAEKKPAPESAPEDADPLKEPANKSGEPEPSGFNEQKGYDALQAELEQQKKNYDELRRKSTQDWQSAAELRKAHEELQSSFKTAINKLNETAVKKVDPAQFMEELQTEGPSAISKHFDVDAKVYDALKPLQDNNTELNKKVASQEYTIEFLKRVADAEHYPDFAKMESKMAEVAADPQNGVNTQAEIGEQLDSYYRLAIDSSSGKAVDAAREDGKRAAEKQLAKEAKTGLAGSGKGTSGSPVDLYDVPLERLEAMLPKAERDGY